MCTKLSSSIFWEVLAKVSPTFAFHSGLNTPAFAEPVEIELRSCYLAVS